MLCVTVAEGQCQSVNAAAPNERITGGASRNRGGRLDPALADFRNKIGTNQTWAVAVQMSALTQTGHWLAIGYAQQRTLAFVTWAISC